MMLDRLSLRLRIFLFFVLLALGGITLVGGALYLGYRRTSPETSTDAFIFAGLLSGFGLLGLTAGIWLLFDENVAKPIERLAAHLRVSAHTDTSQSLDTHSARYLGDIAQAAHAVSNQLNDSAMEQAVAVAAETARLAADRDRLTALLTDVPVAMILANPLHQIVLYDGQAAEVLAQVAPPRLNAALFDYFDRTALKQAFAQIRTSGLEASCTLLAAHGEQSYEARMRPLGDGQGYVLTIDAAHANTDVTASRPLVYDFDLLNSAPAPANNPALKDLCFVVFDTETTGLLPHKDDVVQIGAVRVLRGRIVPSETIDLLVDPGRPIPPASTKVHRVTDAMVQGAPNIAKAGRQFHHFARDAVIVAHNAPFDMAFLHRHAKEMGVTWDHPIVDTVLLSAVIFGASQPHTLDALCDRLDIVIPVHLRHSALGDAQATAEVLCKFLPILAARGITTFDEMLVETRKHGRMLQDLN